MFSRLGWCDPGVWNSRLLLLLVLVMRIVLATVWCRFGSWGLLINLWALWSRFWSWSSGEILKLKFGQYFAADVWLRLRSWILVKIMKLGLVKILSLSLVEMLMFGWDFKVNAQLKFDQDFFGTCDMNSTLGSVVLLAMFDLMVIFVSNINMTLGLIVLCQYMWLENFNAQQGTAFAICNSCHVSF